MLLDIFIPKKEIQFTVAKDKKKLTDSVSRSVLKAISWRIVGTMDTMLIAYLITGTLSQALSIGFIEWGTKMILYFFHERAWNTLHWGRKHNS